MTKRERAQRWQLARRAASMAALAVGLFALAAWPVWLSARPPAPRVVELRAVPEPPTMKTCDASGWCCTSRAWREREREWERAKFGCVRVVARGGNGTIAEGTVHCGELVTP